MTAVARYRISAEDDSTRTIRKVRKGYAGLRDELGAVGGAYRGLQTAAGALTLGYVGGNITQDVQELQDGMARLRILSSDLAGDQQFLHQTADDLSTNYLALTGSYGKFLNLQKAGIVTQGEARQMMIGLTETAKAYGASAGQIENVMYGMAQSLGQGQLQAQELNQVVEPLPGLLNNIALQAGLSGIEFRNLVKDGRVTSAMFKTYLIPALESYEGSAAAMADNVSSSFTRTANQYTRLIEDLEQPLGGGLTAGANAVTAALLGVRENLEVIEDASQATAVTLGVLVTAKLAATLASTQLAGGLGIAAGSLLAGEVAVARYAVATTVATAATRGMTLSVALLGGPIGLAALAVGGLTYAYLSYNEEAVKFKAVTDEAKAATEALIGVSGAAEQGLIDRARAAAKLTEATLAQAEADLIAAQSADAARQAGDPVAFALGIGDAQIEVEQLEGKLNDLRVTLQNTVSDNALIGLASSAKNEIAETAKISKDLQQTLDRLFPQQPIQRKFEIELELLNKNKDQLGAGLEASVAALERDRDAALARLAKPTGKKQDPLGDLLDELYPDRELKAEFDLDLQLLNSSLDAGQIDGEQYNDAVIRLRTSLKSNLEGLHSDTDSQLNAFNQMVEQHWPQRRLQREYEVKVSLLDANSAQLAPGEYGALFTELKEELDAGIARLNDVRPAGDVLDRLFPQQRLTREYTTDVRELNAAFANNSGSEQHVEALRRIATEYELAKRQLGEGGLDPASLDPFYTKALDWNDQLRSSFQSLTGSMNDLWGDVLDDNSDAFSKFMDSVQAEMEEMIYQKYIAETANALAGSIVNGLSGLIGGGTSVSQAKGTQQANTTAFQTGTPLRDLPAYSGGGGNITIQQRITMSGGQSRSAVKQDSRMIAKQTAAAVAKTKARGGSAARALS